MLSLLKEAFLLHSKGQLSQAKKIYQNILTKDSNNFDANHLLGIIALQEKDLNKAKILIKKSINIDSKNYAAFNNLGNVYQKLKNYKEAIINYNKAISLKSDYAEAYNNIGISLRNLKNYKEAIINYNKAISLKPDYAEAYNNQGISLHNIEKYKEAIESYDKAISLKPDYAEAYNNQGISLHNIEKYKEAIESYDKAISLKPDYAEAYNNRGISFSKLKQEDLSLKNYQKAISLKSDYAEAYNNIGISLRNLKNYKEAIINYNKAISLKPDYAEAYNNRGISFLKLKIYNLALKDYNKAISLRHDYAEAYYNKSLLYLIRGDFKKGWMNYEWRKKLFNKDKTRSTANIKELINLKNIRNKKIFIEHEQGLGDTIQFSRYVKLLSDLGAKVMFKTQDPLHELFKNFSNLNESDEFDLYSSLLSLPYVFNTNSKNIPNNSPYLHTNKEIDLFWKNKIKDNGLKIGICWQGNPENELDSERSFELKNFKIISRLKNVRLINLQEKYGLEQLNKLREQLKIENFLIIKNNQDPFINVAAIIKNLDLVITCDTSIAHLSGALNCPTWLILGYNHDWRWMLNNEKSIWYPSIRIFRKKNNELWEDIFKKICNKLKNEYKIIINQPSI